jgi:hypothetical protein
MEAEVYEAFRSIGIADEKAVAAESALSRREPDILSMKGDIGTLKADVGSLKADVATLQVDVALLKWMLGFVFAGVLTLVLKAFVL